MSSKRGRPRSTPASVKGRLIQTRVPEHLEHVLREEAQKRRLSVSHLIRNMLEDTFELVDTVVASAGDLAKDSAAIAEQVRQDAGKVAATVRGAAEDAGKLAAAVRGAAHDAGRMATNVRDAVRGRGGAVRDDGAETERHERSTRDRSRRGDPRRRTPDADDAVGEAKAFEKDTDDSDPAPSSDSPDWERDASDVAAEDARARLAALDHVLGWNPVVANKPVNCVACDLEIPRGGAAHLGISQDPKQPPAWLCADCLASLDA